MPVYGLTIMKHAPCCDQYVTSFKVQMSTDGSFWADVDGGAVFAGSDTSAADNDQKEVSFATRGGTTTSRCVPTS